MLRLLRGFAIGGLVALVALGGARLATCAAGGPIGMLPGGRLRGAWLEGQEPDREVLRARSEVQLQVGSGRPRSVTTWVAVHGGAIYVPADFITPWKRWPHRVLADDRVVLRVGSRLYRRRAVRVRDPDLVAALRRVFAAKYGLAADGRAARSPVWFFRLDPPAPGLKAPQVPADA